MRSYPLLADVHRVGTRTDQKDRARGVVSVYVLTTLLLARHGETDWNRDHRWQGHTGPPLNQTGRQQAVDLAREIDAIDAVYSSDAERAYETALILAERHGLRVVTDARFREVNFGHWEGLTRAQINRRFGRAFTKWLSGEARRPDGGEADEEMAERVFAALAHIFDQHPKERVLVVTSGGQFAPWRRTCWESTKHELVIRSRRFPTARSSNS